MKSHNLLHKIIPVIALSLLLLPGCRGYRKLLQDEVIFFDGSSATGTITACDSTQLVLQKMDLSKQVIPWTDIDTVASVSYKTPVLSFHTGIYTSPYYSAFRGESYTPAGGGFQLRYGTARFGKTYRYTALSVLSGSPYGVTKLGVGTQRYFFTRYTDQFSFYGGIESNLMFIRDNHAPHITLEPFMGGEVVLLEQLHLSARLGFHKNILSLNPGLGVNLSAGVNFLLRNFSRHYQYICEQRKLPVRYSP